MPSVLRYVLAVFAAYRLAAFISHDEGPYLGLVDDPQQTGIFERFRMRAGVYDLGPDGLPETNLGRGIQCPLCVGVYMAAFVLLLVSWPTRFGDLFLGWMGISGAQVFLENLTSDEAVQGAIEDVADSLDT